MKYEDLTYEEKYKIESKNKIKRLQEINEEHKKINGELREENKQLKDNWNKLKEELYNLRCVALTKEFGNEWRECLSFNDDILPIINKMQELENGDSNE